MVNEGKRCYCRCIKEMTMTVGKDIVIVFEFKKVYGCVIKTRDTRFPYYKIYGDEFTLSCNEKEFNDHFKLIKGKVYK